MIYKTIRGALIVILGMIFGILAANGFFQGSERYLIGAGIGAIMAIIFLVITPTLLAAPLKISIGGFFGLLIGIATGYMVKLVINPLPLDEIRGFIEFVILVFFSILGVLIGVKKIGAFDIYNLRRFFQEKEGFKDYKILDTSVIIDGRIADICESGFLEGVLIIPQFVLTELQHIADSSDTLKRNRGRRGLDILRKVQKFTEIEVEIVDKDFPNVKEVDLKLVELAKFYGGKLITNDYNLNKVSELHGVTVLNINELANAVKPVVLPGEEMKVFILKEGKEASQGVAYLDDGTMVVVDHGQEYIGQNVKVTVTSVLQTTAGRMIFGKLTEEIMREKEIARRR